MREYGREIEDASTLIDYGRLNGRNLMFAHPAQHRVTDTALDIGDAGLRLVPASI